MYLKASKKHLLEGLGCKILSLKTFLQETAAADLDRLLFPCRWIDLDSESYAKRPGRVQTGRGVSGHW